MVTSSDKRPPKNAKAPRLANRIAGDLRKRILSGAMAQDERLPSQEKLMDEFRVSQPSIREALRILEADGLVTVRRGKAGGAIVHPPTSEVAAATIASILQSRDVCLEDVGRAIQSLEPMCCELAARRRDRRKHVVPQLRQQLARVRSVIEDPENYRTEAAAFRQALIQASGNDTLLVLVGALEALWAAHAEARALAGTWPRPVTKADRRRYFASNEALVNAIESGDCELARSLSAAHLRKATRHTLVDDDQIGIDASLLVDVL
jgi:GntR family transcriptional regulator, transcriptional repressor for pyruvate dehydrogenase complex